MLDLTLEEDYTGPKALELYLQAYQLILRKQIWTLVHILHLPAELELVTKDLWQLRLELLRDRLRTTDDLDTVFSSQQKSATEAENPGISKRRKWNSRAKRTPNILESLALCYMAVTTLRLPIGMGDLYR